MERLATICEDVCGAFMHAWELGRRAVDRPGGPSMEEVDDLLHKGFEWHDAAEKIRGKAR